MSIPKTPKDILDYLSDKHYVIEEMKTIHFSADFHHSHPKIITICNRPTTPEEHNDWLVKEVINKYVQRKHSLYILGDVSMAKRSEAEKFVDRLNGNKWLILGNHCKNLINSTRFSQITQIKDFTYSKDGLNIHIVLCHYPLYSYNRKIYESWHLYGHVHGRKEFILNNIKNFGYVYDVGIDNREFIEHSYKPVNLYEVCEIMYKRECQINELI